MVYKQSFSCKINCTKVKQTAIKITEVQMRQIGPGVRVSLLQMRDSDSTPLIYPEI